MKWLLTLAVIAILAMVAACGAVPKTSTATSPTTPATTPPTSATTTPGTTVPFGSLADAGKQVYAANCAICHGNNGQGVTAPALIGANAQLVKYGTAAALLNFIDTNMPFNKPGTLTHTEYLQVLAYLLVQNNDVSQSTPFMNEGQLGAINLK